MTITKYFENKIMEGILFSQGNIYIGEFIEKQFNQKLLDIIKVIFNNPATIVYWKDGDKTIVKCGEKDTYDKEKGLSMCICKKIFGNKGNYNEVFKKWIIE